jgi:hypothetical protein
MIRSTKNFPLLDPIPKIFIIEPDLNAINLVLTT